MNNSFEMLFAEINNKKDFMDGSTYIKLHLSEFKIFQPFVLLIGFFCVFSTRENNHLYLIFSISPEQLIDLQELYQTNLFYQCQLNKLNTIGLYFPKVNNVSLNNYFVDKKRAYLKVFLFSNNLTKLKINGLENDLIHKYKIKKNKINYEEGTSGYESISIFLNELSYSELNNISNYLCSFNFIRDIFVLLDDSFNSNEECNKILKTNGFKIVK